jgi:hypothetical protein
LDAYIFRVAISNQRIVKMSSTHVTFRYRSTKTGETKTCTVSAEDFIRRFLQHVLPKGFVKVRYYGFFSPGLRTRLASLRAQLDRLQPNHPSIDREQRKGDQHTDYLLCPSCGQIMQKRKAFLLMSSSLPDFRFPLLVCAHQQRCTSSNRCTLVGAPIDYPNLFFTNRYSPFMAIIERIY